VTAEPRRVAVLGATGSIGESALEVIRRHPDRFRVAALSAHRQAERLDRLALEFSPDFVVLTDTPDRGFRPEWRGEWRSGDSALMDAVADDGVDIVLNALVGIAGLGATLGALEAGKRLALANKESLVAGGELVLEANRRGGGELIPVDSEHSAIHQCLGGSDASDVARLILTASGGPFRERSPEDFDAIRPEDALAHPTWDMGAKITIDSATLANKALEVIEAHHLFGVPFDRIEVVVHPTSIVHSMVELRDGSVLAQLGFPTMEIPIAHALTWPECVAERRVGFDPVRASPLVFEPLRHEAFPMFGIGVEAGRQGGELPVAYNAANEVAVAAFLDGKLRFSDLPRVVEAVLGVFSATPLPDVESVWRIDRAAREAASRVASSRNSLGAAG